MAAELQAAPDPWLAGARRLARAMDHHHLDPILGLVLPGVGDVLGGALGLYILAVAVKRRAPRLTLARMMLHIAVDVGVGAIPLVGDAFDFYFHASSRNLALLERPGTPTRHAWVDGGILMLACVALLAALCLPSILCVWLLLRWRHAP